MDRIPSIALNFFQMTDASYSPMICRIQLLDVLLLLLQHVPGNEQKNKSKDVYFVKTMGKWNLITNSTY
jgi:hypothetical protein